VRRMGRVPLILIWLAAFWGLGWAGSATALAGWTGRRPFRGSSGDTIHYYSFSPETIEASEKYPLVIWLHGGLRSNGVGGPNVPTEAFYRDAHQKQRPCFVLRPVAVKGKNWVSPRGAGTGTHRQPERPAPSITVLIELLETVLRRHPIDAGSVHVIGASMGGYGTWDIITRYPNEFASAVPICGGGDPSKAALIKHMKIWIFHSADDRIVPVGGSQDMFRALMKAKGKSPSVSEDEQKTVSRSPDGKIRYTQYKKGGHNSWDRALRAPELIRWVFAKP